MVDSMCPFLAFEGRFLALTDLERVRFESLRLRKRGIIVLGANNLQEDGNQGG